MGDVEIEGMSEKIKAHDEWVDKYNTALAKSGTLLES